jgi:arylsulfatase A-like enzyme
MGLSHSRFGWDLLDGEIHLAGALREAGYRTTSIGVAHESQRDPRAWGYEARVELREEAAGAEPVCSATVSRLREYASGEAPFFISAGCYEPHRLPGPGEDDYMGFLGAYMEVDTGKGIHVPPYLRDDEGTRAELAELQGAVRYMDEQFGRVLQGIDELGLRENTLVIFTTDHGVAMPRAKCSCYDPGIEIALILRLPSRSGWHGGRRVDDLIPNIDLMPSLCDLAGAQAPTLVQGRSWVPLLDAAAYEPNEAIFPELTYHDYYDPMRGVRTDRYKLLAFFSSAPSYMPPNQSWKPRSSPKEPPVPPTAYHPYFELYDLDQDPWEQDNVFEDHAYERVRRELLRRLRTHLEQTKDPILRGAVTPPLHRKVLEWLEE